MSKLTKLLSLLLAFALVAAACSSDGDDADGDTEIGLAGGGVDDEAMEEALEETSTTVADEEVMEEAIGIDELEAQWADARAVVVAALSVDEYGVGDDNILRGPGGYEVDLNECPADWSDTAGLDGGTIPIGHTTALSGDLAAFGNIAAGMEAYFDYVNDTGGIAGAPSELIVKDDAYVDTKTIELVDELIQVEDPFYITTLGSPNTLAVYDTLNEACIPHPFVMTAHPAWGDPIEHPFTSGLQLSFSTEAIFWGNWIKVNMVDQLPAKVAGLVMDNYFGLAFKDSFEKWAELNPDVVSEFQAVSHDPLASTVTNEMTTVAAGDPDVFISMTAGPSCLLAVQEAGNNGMTTDGTVLFMPSVCKAPNANMIPAGDAANGWLIVGGGVKATTDPQYADDPYVSFVNETLAAAGLDTSGGLYGTGFANYAWPHVEAMRIAAELPGGLSRTNMLLAMRGIDLVHPITLEGISFSVNGAKDAYYIEGSEISLYDAEAESWFQQGATVDLNGSSPNCTWTEDGC